MTVTVTCCAAPDVLPAEIGDAGVESGIAIRRPVVAEIHLPPLDVALAERRKRHAPGPFAHQPPTCCVADRINEAIWSIIGINGGEVGNGQLDATAAPHHDLEIASQVRRDVAHVGDEITAIGKRQLPIVDVPAHQPAVSDADQVSDADTPIECAQHHGRPSLELPDHGPAGLDHDTFSGELAVNDPANFDIAAIANFPQNSEFRSNDCKRGLNSHVVVSAFENVQAMASIWNSALCDNAMLSPLHSQHLA